MTRAALALTFLLAACGTTTTTPPPAAPGEHLTIGVHADVPGWGKSVGGAWSGYDYALARWLGQDLGFTVRPYDTLSLNRETLIKEGTVDAVIATYSATDARAKEVDFVGPYLIAKQALLVRKTDAAALAKVKPQNLTGCVQEGSTSQDQLDHYGYASFSASATLTECLDQLDTGKVQAIGTDDLVLYGFVNDHPGRYEILGTRIGHLELYGIGVRKGNFELCQRLRGALGRFVTTGLWQTFLANNLPTMPPSEYDTHSPLKVSEFSCTPPQ
ncbi:transporter substrate-binding domain-containing protein [Winogradskya consettensis]|nr:transporter substrate-binding domain-containing protein [Actinoplanes consettensis]